MYFINKSFIFKLFIILTVHTNLIQTLRFIPLQTGNVSKNISYNKKNKINLTPTKYFIPKIKKDILFNILDEIQHLFVDISIESDFNEELFNFFLHQTTTPVFTTIDCYSNRNTNSSYGIVTSLRKLIESKCHFYKSGVYFFIMNSNDNYTTEFITENLQKHWQYYEIHKVYIVAKKDIKIYYPFALNVEREEKWGKLFSLLTSKEDDFHINILKNLNGYPLRMQLFRSVLSEPIYSNTTNKTIYCEGTDAKAMYLLSDKMNFTIILQEADPDYFGIRLPNGSFSGGIGLLIRNESDAVFTGYFIKDYNTREFEYTVGVYDDKLCIFLLKSGKIPPSILPLFSIGYDMWILYVLVAFSCGTILSLMYWAYLLNSNFRTLSIKKIFQIYIDTWIVWVRVGLIKLPEFQSGRIFILSVSMVSVIFGAIFESSLATVYTKPLFYPDINTLQQLAKTGFQITYKYESMKDDLFPKNVSPTYDFLDNKLILIGKNKSNIDYIIDFKNFASVNRWLGIQLSDSVYYTRNILHVLPECPKLYMLSYILQKNSPFAERINNLLLDFLAAGLIDQWTEEIKYNESISHLKDPHTKEHSSVKVLSLRDLQLSFYVLIIGSLLGGFVLMLEIFKNKHELKHGMNLNKKPEMEKNQKKVKIIIQVKK